VSSSGPIRIVKLIGPRKKQQGQAQLRFVFAVGRCYYQRMKRGQRMRKDALRRYLIYRMKLTELLHLHLLWCALQEDKFVPKNILGHDGQDFALSVRTVVLGWLCTILDQSSDGLNVFDLWRLLFPKHRKKIENAWSEIAPHWGALREFRDKCGFHADTPRHYFAARQSVLDNPQAAKAVQDFLRLAIFFLRKENEELPDFVPAVEEFLLDFELESGASLKREFFKRSGILPRESHKEVFG
jgi:hypothetical protein